MKKSLFAGIVILVMVIVVSQVAYAGGGKFEIGCILGRFVPGDPQVTGTENIYYDSLGLAVSATVNGFGYGNEITVKGSYCFNELELRFEAGVCLLLERKVAIVTASTKDSYENKLTMIPLCLSFIYKARLRNSDFEPYIGMGPGLYITSWEVIYRHAPFGGTFIQTNDKSSRSLFGAHFISGLSYHLSGHVSISGELRYSVVKGCYEVMHRLNDLPEYKGSESNVSLGGTTMRIGFAYSL